MRAVNMYMSNYYSRVKRRAFGNFLLKLSVSFMSSGRSPENYVLPYSADASTGRFFSAHTQEVVKFPDSSPLPHLDPVPGQCLPL